MESSWIFCVFKVKFHTWPTMDHVIYVLCFKFSHIHIYLRFSHRSWLNDRCNHLIGHQFSQANILCIYNMNTLKHFNTCNCLIMEQNHNRTQQTLMRNTRLSLLLLELGENILSILDGERHMDIFHLVMYILDLDIPYY